jgi:hypothetical protein
MVLLIFYINDLPPAAILSVHPLFLSDSPAGIKISMIEIGKRITV